MVLIKPSNYDTCNKMFYPSFSSALCKLSLQSCVYLLSVDIMYHTLLGWPNPHLGFLLLRDTVFQSEARIEKEVWKHQEKVSIIELRFVVVALLKAMNLFHLYKKWHCLVVMCHMSVLLFYKHLYYNIIIILLKTYIQKTEVDCVIEEHDTSIWLDMFLYSLTV